MRVESRLRRGRQRRRDERMRTVNALDKGKMLGEKYVHEHVEQLTVNAYLEAGYQAASENYDREITRDNFLLGWWYVGYPFFGLMRAEQFESAGLTNVASPVLSIW